MLYHYREYLQMVALGDENKVTNQEGLSITAYSMGAYRPINTKLRKGLMTGPDDPNKLGPQEQDYTLTTMSGLNKLKPYKGTVYRHGELFDGYSEINHEGAIVNDMGFMSTTYMAASLRSDFGTDTLEIIKSKTGRFIKPLSAKYKEDEVLFKPGTRFKITKRYTAKADLIDPNERWPKNMSQSVWDVLNKDPFGTKIKMIVIKEEI